MDYQSFLSQKQVTVGSTGFHVDTVNPKLFEFQEQIVKLALRKGKFCIFAGCGMGKTGMQLEWANQVVQYTGGKVLLLAPLAVATQTVREAEKFGIDSTVGYARSQKDASTDIVIANYEMMSKFNASQFVGVVLDESSILKSFNGKTRNEILDTFAQTPYRLACSATPAPNDYMELGNHAEFVGAMSREEMLAMFFTHDGGTTSQWRLKGHAEEKFWEWMASWSVMIRSPKDLGFDSTGFDLPPLHVNEVVTKTHLQPTDGQLFFVEATTLTEQRKVRKASIDERVQRTAELVNNSDEQWLVWCDLNEESEKLTKAIADAIEVKGSDSNEHKESAVQLFLNYQEQKCFQVQTQKTDQPHSVKKNEKKSTTKNGTPKTEIELERTEPKQKKNETKEGVNFTLKKNTEELKRLLMLMNGKRKTQKKDLHSDSKSLGLHCKNTMHCLSGKTESVQFAAEQNVLTLFQSADLKQENESCISITVMKQVLSEDCCVLRATWGWENSKITQTHLSKPQDICKTQKKGRVLISKPSIFGFGLNFQNCHNMVFVGLSHSFEMYYQAVRRCWRFGQANPVNVHIVYDHLEGAVIRNIERKEKESEHMADQMVRHMISAMLQEMQLTRTQTGYNPSVEMIIPDWLVSETLSNRGTIPTSLSSDDRQVA